MARKRWWVALVAMLALVGMLFLPGCSPDGSGAKRTDAEATGETQNVEGDDAVAAESEASEAEANEGAKSEGVELEEGQDAEVDTSDVEGDSAQDRSVGGARAPGVTEDGTYTSKEEVALYLHEFGHLPSNYVTKDEAEDAGWKTEGLSLDEACPGKSIGGDRFGNREKRLPNAKGRTWYECDIDYRGGSRGAKRIVYSNDGLIYYTGNHYKTFEQLY